MTSIIQCRQLTIREIFSLGCLIFKKYFRMILAITLMICIPIRVVLYYILSVQYISLNSYDTIISQARLLNFLEALIGIIATLAIAFLVENAVHEKDVTLGETFKKAISRWGHAVGTNIIMGVTLILLTLLLIIPGIIWGIYYYFAIYVVALRNISGKSALRYSKSLVQGQWLRVFGIILGFIILIIITSFLMGFVSAFLPETATISILTDLIIDLVTSFTTVTTTILFLNLDYNKSDENVIDDNFE